MAGCNPWLVYVLIWLLLAAVPEAFRELHTGERVEQMSKGCQAGFRHCDHSGMPPWWFLYRIAWSYSRSKGWAGV